MGGYKEVRVSNQITTIPFRTTDAMPRFWGSDFPAFLPLTMAFAASVKPMTGSTMGHPFVTKQKTPINMERIAEIIILPSPLTDARSGQHSLRHSDQGPGLFDGRIQCP